MIESASYFLMLTALIAAFVAINRALRWWLTDRAKRAIQNKFRLYTVRDQLVHLVATGQLSENDWLFDVYYTALNGIVRHQEKFTLYALVKSMRAATHSSESREFANKLRQELLRYESRDVKETIASFYVAMLEIVLENSFSLRSVKRVGELATPLLSFWRFVAKITTFRSVAEPRVFALEVYGVSDKTLRSLQ